MPVVALVVAIVLVALAGGAIAYFAYAYHRYHGVPVPVRRCRATDGCVHVNGFDLFMRELGAEHGGVPVVVLHGGPGHSCLSFKDGLDFLAEHRWLVMYDQRGSGLSEVQAERASYSVDALIEELEALRREVLRVDTIDLIGHSAGGALAQRYLLAHPSRVRRLVLVGSTSANNNMSNAALWRLLGPGLYALGMGFPPDQPGQADGWFESSQLEADTRRLFDPSDPRPVQDSGPITFTTWFAVSQSLAGDSQATQLSHVVTPTLVVYGEADSPYTGGKAAKMIAGTLPDARAVCVPRSGHWPFLENPEEFRLAIDSFMTDGVGKVGPA